MATKLQVLQDHCRQFEESLTSCTSEAEAERAREAACRRLGEVCKNEMMQEMLAEHARQLIRDRLGPASAGN